MHYLFFPALLLFFSPKEISNSTPSEPMTAWQIELIKEVNVIRAEGCRCPGGKKYAPAPPIKWNAQLAKAAQGHANDMKRRDYFNHTTPDGVRFYERIEAQGYTYATVAENIAWGYTNAKAVVKGWKESKGHCKNLMNPAFNEMGGGLTGKYWVQDLGSQE